MEVSGSNVSLELSTSAKRFSLTSDCEVGCLIPSRQFRKQAYMHIVRECSNWRALLQKAGSGFFSHRVCFLHTFCTHVPGCSGMEIEEKSGSLDKAPLALPLCWFSHSLLSLLNTAANLIFQHPLFPAHCPSALSQLYSWSQAITSLCCHPGCHGRKGPWGPLGNHFAPICTFVLFLTIRFSVHWLVSKPVLWKGQHLKNMCVYNTRSSDQADHQADDEGRTY